MKMYFCENKVTLIGKKEELANYGSPTHLALDKFKLDFLNPNEVGKILLELPESTSPSYSIFGNITLTKQLHAGHLAGLVSGYILKRSLNSRRYIVSNNDTSPRVVSVIKYLQHEHSLDEKSAIERLLNGGFSPKEITEAYRRCPEVNEGDLNSFELPPNPLRVMNEYTQELIDRLGLEALVVSESSIITQTLEKNIDELSRQKLVEKEFEEFGLLPIIYLDMPPIDLKRSGRYTAYAKALSLYLYAHENYDGVVSIVGEYIDKLVVNFLNRIGKNIRIIPGTKLTINGQTLSGKKGIGMLAEELVNNLEASGLSSKDIKNSLVYGVANNFDGIRTKDFVRYLLESQKEAQRIQSLPNDIGRLNTYNCEFNKKISALLRACYEILFTPQETILKSFERGKVLFLDRLKQLQSLINKIENVPENVKEVMYKAALTGLRRVGFDYE